MNIPGSDVQLDDQCWRCEGVGTVPDEERTNKNYPRDKSCYVCNGTGAVLTVAGEEFVDFIERHFNISRMRG
jgi:DnaJ-class molecular chaperone